MSFTRGAIPFLRRCILEHSLKQSFPAIPRRFAGHSHWQNTRHIKAATDAHRQSVTTRFVRLIEAAVTTGGGGDPKANATLASVIEQAKRTQVVPNAVIESTIKRILDPTAKKSTIPMVYEFFGENGAMAVAQAETINASKLKHDLKHICKKHVWGVIKGGVKERFQETQYVIVSGKQDGSPVDSDEILAVGIEGGAEDMNEIGDGADKLYEFTCALGTQFTLSRSLQNANYTINDIGVKWVPQVALEVDEAYAKKVSAFCDSLEEHPEIVAVYTNLA